jgi:hypothetical protein
MPLIYPFMPRQLKNKLYIYNHKWSNKDTTLLDDFELDTEKDIIKDMQKLKDTFFEKEIINDKVGSFINACIKKYGEKTTKYYFKHLMEDFFVKGI